MSKEFLTKTQANKAKPAGYTTRRKKNGRWVFEKVKSIKYGKAEQKLEVSNL